MFSCIGESLTDQLTFTDGSGFSEENAFFHKNAN